MIIHITILEIKIYNIKIFYDKDNENRRKIYISFSIFSLFLYFPKAWTVSSLDTFISHHPCIQRLFLLISILFFFRSTYLLYSQNLGNLLARRISKLQATQCRTNPPSFVLNSLPCSPTSRPLEYPHVHFI